MEQFMQLDRRGLGLEKASIHLGSSPRHDRGFGLTELTISMGLLLIVIAGVYFSTTQSTGRATRTVRNSQLTYETAKALARLEQEITNIVIMRRVGSSERTTVLGNLNEDTENDGDEKDFIPYGLIPFPGFRVQDMNARTDLSPRDSRFFHNEAEPGVSDALRLVSYTNDSVSLSVAYQDVLTRTYFPTTQDGVTNHIILRSREGLQVGDFAVIQDRIASDLFRITAINDHVPQAGLYEIHHDADLSIWNLPFRRNYGAGDNGPVYVREVSILTYAHDPDQKTLLRMDHVFDDGFSPVTQMFPTVVSPGLQCLSNDLACNWMPFILDISEFKVEYVLGETSSTRRPAAAPYGSAGGDGLRGNELGRPHLQRIRFNMRQLQTKTTQTQAKAGVKEPVVLEREFNPLNLLGARGEAGNPGAEDAECYVLYEGEPRDCNFVVPTPVEDDDDDGGAGGDEGDDDEGDAFGPPGSGGGGL